MVEGHPCGLGNYGAVGVFKEASRLQCKYLSLLAPFIFAFVLPTAIIQLLEVLGLAWWMSTQSPFVPPVSHLLRLLHNPSAPPPMPPAPSGRALLVMLAVLLLMWLLASLAVASISKSVEYIYSEEEDPSATTSIFKSLPSAIVRLVATSLCLLLLILLAVVAISVPFFLLSLVFKHAPVLAALQQVAISIAVTILGFFFLLAQEVAVLEPSNYGFAALKRSAKLVQGKAVPALALFVFSAVVGGLLSNVANAVAGKVARGEWGVWVGFALAVVAVVYVGFEVYVVLATVVLYFVAKVKCDGEGAGLPVENPYAPLVVPAEE